MAQAISKSATRSNWAPRWLYLIAAIAIVIVAAGTYQQWLPLVGGLLASPHSSVGESASKAVRSVSEEEDSHGHDHEAAGHDDANSLELSAQARRNIGLKIAPVELSTFTRTISVPGIIVERPGRSTIQIAAPMTGIVTKIYPIEGEALEPGQKLFDLRLTHEELVQAQADLLKTVEELDVLEREIARIEQLASGGALAGKTVIERKYERQRQLGIQRAQRQALLLHGLSEEQIDNIVKERRLLPGITMAVPTPGESSELAEKRPVLQVQALKVSLGQSVTAGETLAVLVNHEQLFIQGNAFERDAAAINKAADAGAPVSASLDSDGESQTISDLKILYSATNVDSDSRTLGFFVMLPNQLGRDTKLSDGRRIVAWKYRPGQRMQIQVPVETWNDRIVVPPEAIAEDGAETYLFVPNGDHLDRRSVHVEYRDNRSVVIANDGAIFPGDLIAISGAQQLQLALKNKAGGGIDPHAGHHH